VVGFSVAEGAVRVAYFGKVILMIGPGVTAAEVSPRSVAAMILEDVMFEIFLFFIYYNKYN
jgi:hypothetical protein